MKIQEVWEKIRKNAPTTALMVIETIAIQGLAGMLAYALLKKNPTSAGAAKSGLNRILSARFVLEGLYRIFNLTVYDFAHTTALFWVFGFADTTLVIKNVSKAYIQDKNSRLLFLFSLKMGVAFIKGKKMLYTAANFLYKEIVKNVSLLFASKLLVAAYEPKSAFNYHFKTYTEKQKNTGAVADAVRYVKETVCAYTSAVFRF